MRLLALALVLCACGGGKPPPPWLFVKPPPSADQIQIDFKALEAGPFRFKLGTRSITPQQLVRTPLENGTLVRGTFGKNGSLAFALCGSSVTGVVREGSFGFEIIPAGGRHRLVPRSWKPPLRPLHDPGWDAISGARGAAPTLVSTEPVVFDVFFAYTPAVLEDRKLDGIKCIAANAIADLNTACAKGCPGVEFRFSVAKRATTDTEIKPDGTGRKDMHYIYTELLKKLAFAEAHAGREAAYADILVLLVDSVHGGVGLGTIMGEPETAVAVADYHDSLWYLTIPHEIGHIMGGLHNDDEREDPFRFGHAYSVDGSERTIMSKPCAKTDTCPLAKRWSEKPFGDDDWRDNARVLRTTAATVSKFRVRPVVAPP